MKVGQLILSKIIKIVATSCQILRLKCTRFDFGWGRLLLDLTGPISKWRAFLSGGHGRERQGRRGEGRREGKGRGERGGTLTFQHVPRLVVQSPDHCHHSVLPEEKTSSLALGLRPRGHQFPRVFIGFLNVLL